MAKSHINIADVRNMMELLEEAGFDARMAGGCVRDRLMGEVPNDYDIATTALPDAVCTLFRQKGYRVAPTGIEHGTVTVVGGSGAVEITTLRRDVKTDGRHAIVEFHGATFEDDAMRRDFTINALFEDRHGAIHDYVGGLKDIERRQLKFVGDAGQRIREDFLRIMRFFRFWARLGFAADPDAIAAIELEAPGLKFISQERITSELLQLLECSDPIPALVAMHDAGVTDIILPEIAVGAKNASSQVLAALKAIPKTSRGIARCAFMATQQQLPKKETEKLSKRLRLSGVQGNLLLTLAFELDILQKTDESIAGVMNFIDRCEEYAGDGSFLHILAPYWEITQKDQVQGLKAKLKNAVKIEKSLRHRRKMPLPIDGHQLGAELGLAPGPKLGKILAVLRNEFRNGTWETKDEGVSLAKTLSS